MKLPEYKQIDRNMWPMTKQRQAEAWNRCIDEVKRLNREKK